MRCISPERHRGYRDPVCAQATAIMLFKRFYLSHSVVEHDPQVIMCVSGCVLQSHNLS